MSAANTPIDGEALQAQYDLKVKAGIFIQRREGEDHASEFEAFEKKLTKTQKTSVKWDSPELITTPQALNKFSTVDGNVVLLRLGMYFYNFNHIDEDLISTLFDGYTGFHSLFNSAETINTLHTEELEYVSTVYLAISFAFKPVWSSQDMFMLKENGINIPGIGLTRSNTATRSFFAAHLTSGEDKIAALKQIGSSFTEDLWRKCSDLDQQQILSMLYPHVNIDGDKYPRLGWGESVRIKVQELLHMDKEDASEQEIIRPDRNFSLGNLEYWRTMFPAFYQLDPNVYTMNDVDKSVYGATVDKFFVAYNLPESPQREELIHTEFLNVVRLLNKAKGVDPAILAQLRKKQHTFAETSFNKEILKNAKSLMKTQAKYKPKRERQ